MMRLVSVSGRVRRISPCVRSTIESCRRTKNGHEKGQQVPFAAAAPGSRNELRIRVHSCSFVLLSPHFVANRDDFRSAEFIPLQGPPTPRCRILSFTLLVRDVMRTEVRAPFWLRPCRAVSPWFILPSI